MIESTLITPKALKPGDTIGLVSPSMRLTEFLASRHKRSVECLESLGFQVKEILSPIPPDSSRRERIAIRAGELHTAFSDPEIKAVVCTCGGSHANELLRVLDYDLIRKNPKIFVGYSDITLLHLGLYTQAQLRTFYGPTPLVEFGEDDPMEFTVKHFQQVLSGQVGGKDYVMPRSESYAPFMPNQFMHAIGLAEAADPHIKIPSPGPRWLQEGRCQGRIMGGCLEAMLGLPGTKYWPSFQGCIFLVETAMGEEAGSPLDLSVFRTGLTTLAMLGVYEQCVGIVVGRPLLPRDEEKAIEYRKDYWKVLQDVLEAEEFKGPVLADVDVGHSDPMLTVPLGALCELDSSKNAWSVVESAVSS